MASFISTFITVGICLAIYAYLKKKYTAQIQILNEQISSLSLEILHQRSKVKELDNSLFTKEKEIANYSTRLEAMININKELNAHMQKGNVPAPTSVSKATSVDSEAPKRGRKPGSKKLYYKKKSGGSPS